MPSTRIVQLAETMTPALEDYRRQRREEATGDSESDGVEFPGPPRVVMPAGTAGLPCGGHSRGHPERLRRW